jgi:Replication protein/Transposase zinc-binding domain
MSSLRISAAVRELITKRKKAKNERDRQQPKLIENREVHKASMEAKLVGLANGNQFENFLKCGQEEIFQTCSSCGTHQTFYFACNRKWCPLCNHKIASKRASELKEWAMRIRQPKHLVLTMKNFAVLTRRRIREFQKALVCLRRNKLFKALLGGCTSIEITNSGEGWHLHAHSLLDMRWLDMEKISVEWGRLVGQQFAIVKVKDVRHTEYLQEVSKYVAKGSELASWSPEQLWEFILAIKGCRFFFAFGTLRKAMPEVRRAIEARKGPGKQCKCGCSKFIYETEASSIIHEVNRAARRR